MPQLAPTLGYLLFLGILVPYLLIMMMVSKKVTGPSTLSVSSTRKSLLF